MMSVVVHEMELLYIVDSLRGTRTLDLVAKVLGIGPFCMKK